MYAELEHQLQTEGHEAILVQHLCHDLVDSGFHITESMREKIRHVFFENRIGNRPLAVGKLADFVIQAVPELVAPQARHRMFGTSKLKQIFKNVGINVTVTKVTGMIR